MGRSAKPLPKHVLAAQGTTNPCFDPPVWVSARLTGSSWHGWRACRGHDTRREQAGVDRWPLVSPATHSVAGGSGRVRQGSARKATGQTTGTHPAATVSKHQRAVRETVAVDSFPTAAMTQALNRGSLQVLARMPYILRQSSILNVTRTSLATLQMLTSCCV